MKLIPFAKTTFDVSTQKASQYLITQNSLIPLSLLIGISVTPCLIRVVTYMDLRHVRKRLWYLKPVSVSSISSVTINLKRDWFIPDFANVPTTRKSSQSKSYIMICVIRLILNDKLICSDYAWYRRWVHASIFYSINEWILLVVDAVIYSKLFGRCVALPFTPLLVPRDWIVFEINKK